MSQERGKNREASQLISISVQRLPADATVVRLVGELTDDSAGVVQRSVNQELARSPAQLIIDLSAVSVIDVVGVNVLASAAGIAGEEDISFCLVDAGGNALAAALGAAKMTELFEVFGTVDDAVAAHRPPPDG